MIFMNTSEKMFFEIGNKLSEESDHVSIGKMMSSPGFKYKDKVFAFYYKEQMVFKLGREFDLPSIGINNFSLLSPFKTKPPLADWFEIPSEYAGRWEELARTAMKKLESDII
jgi:hypothetical protein